MRRNVSAILACGMSAVLAIPATAQDESYVVLLPVKGVIYVSMLTEPEVEKELKLTGYQVRRAEQLKREIGERLVKAGLFNPGLPPEQGRKVMAEADAAARVAVRGLLDPEQAKRFEQLRLQNSGIAALVEEDVVRALKLSDDQRSKIREIDMAMKLEMIRVWEQKSNEARRTAFTRALAILTPEQELIWKGLTGKPLEVKFRFPKGPIVGPARGGPPVGSSGSGKDQP